MGRCMLIAVCAMLPTAGASRALQTIASNVPCLTSALADAAVDRVVFETGHYPRSAQLNVGRSETLRRSVARREAGSATAALYGDLFSRTRSQNPSILNRVAPMFQVDYQAACMPFGVALAPRHIVSLFTYQPVRVRCPHHIPCSPV